MQVREESVIEISDFFELSQEGGTYEIETPDGWVEIGDLVKKKNKECFVVRTESGLELGGSDDHYVETDRGWVKLSDIDVQKDSVSTKDGQDTIVSQESIGIHDTFDFEVKSSEHRYYANNIVSHNTGKTTIGYILCNNMPEDATVLWVTPELIVENNDSQFGLKNLYKFAEYVSPCVMILEDLDLYGEDRSNTHGDLRLGTLMNILDGVNTVKNAVTIATTNRLEMIETALRDRPGRFDRHIEIKSLGENLRHDMFTNRLDDCKVEDGIIDYLVGKTDDWTGAEIQEFINSLNLLFIQDDDVTRAVTEERVDEVLGTMSSFGIGDTSSAFGFSKDNK